MVIWVTTAPARRRRGSPGDPAPFLGSGVQALPSPRKTTLLGFWKSGGGVREVQNKLLAGLSLQRTDC